MVQLATKNFLCLCPKLGINSCRFLWFPVGRLSYLLISCNDVLSAPNVAVPITPMQPELTSVVSSSSPLLFAPSPRIAPDNGHYFLSPPRGSPESSSPYSSPMTSTPILTPETGSEFLNDISVQLSNCLSAQDWTRNVWQDHSLFV